MRLLLLSSLVVVAACGTEPDSRPLTLEVVALEVLAPACGQVQCHSTATHTEGYAFDTIEATRASISSAQEVSRLIREIDDGNMPPDAPMPAEDVALLKAWVAAGAPGL